MFLLKILKIEHFAKDIALQFALQSENCFVIFFQFFNKQQFRYCCLFEQGEEGRFKLLQETTRACNF